MGNTGYVEGLRARIGHRLLLLPGVAALVWDAQGRLLVQQREAGGWSLPGGLIDPGETPAEAVVRELREETGLDVVPERIAGVYGGRDYRRRYENGDEVETTSIVFVCRITGGSIRPQPDETRSLHFLPPDEVRSLGLSFPGDLFDPDDRAPARFDPPPSRP